jgi:hypothetical protein
MSLNDRAETRRSFRDFAIEIFGATRTASRTGVNR